MRSTTKSNNPEKQIDSAVNKTEYKSSEMVMDTPIGKWLKAMHKNGMIKPGGKLMFVDRNKS